MFDMKQWHLEKSMCVNDKQTVAKCGQLFKFSAGEVGLPLQKVMLFDMNIYEN